MATKKNASRTGSRKKKGATSKRATAETQAAVAPENLALDLPEPPVAPENAAEKTTEEVKVAEEIIAPQEAPAPPAPEPQQEPAPENEQPQEPALTEAPEAPVLPQPRPQKPFPSRAAFDAMVAEEKSQPRRRAQAMKAATKQTAPLFADKPGWFLAFMGLWALLPLPFGANRPWSSDLMGVFCALILMAALYARYKKPEKWEGAAPYKRLAVAVGLMTALIGWSWVQVVSWTPLAWHHPLWIEAAPLTGQSPSDGAISIDPSAAQESLTRVLSYVVFFLLALFAGRDGARAKLMLRVFVGTACFYAVYGLLDHWLGIERVLWFPKTMYEGFVTGPFINKNSFATYTGLAFLASLALLWQQMKHRFGMGGTNFSWGIRFVTFCTGLKRKDLFVFLPPVLLFCALVLSGSRAGFFSTAGGALVFVVCLIINRFGISWRGLAIGLVLIGLLGGLLAASGHLLVARGEGVSPTLGEDAEMRLRAYDLAADAILDNPWLGFGLGAFENAFRLYRNDTLPLRFQHAHNDYLELAVEWGLPACIVFGVMLLVLLSLCAQGVRQRRRMEYVPTLGLAASVLVGLHALADFSLQIPAIAASYAILLGLGVAQSWSDRPGKETRGVRQI